MSFLLPDTRWLIRAAAGPEYVPADARALIADPTNALAFSAASIWEVAIRTAPGRPGFRTDPRRLRSGLLRGGYRELPVTAERGIAVARLPPVHRDPFDRSLVAQAGVEGAILLTADRTVARCPGPVRLVAAWCRLRPASLTRHAPGFT
ncbi:type II toxin-antitoxin system VapC family toxin [Dankookia sp. GCM10030260]|uniref:type II toxin-antitoxin system VapC family toxin n=1 Tax=Dankookia sp. GCM10030260 TaxID=3273390 RepID=UPI00360D7614